MNALPNEQLVEDLVAIWRLLSQLSAPTQQGEITGQQFWLLRHLRRNGPTRIGDLAESLGISQSAATTSCKRLEAAGLIQRERERADERMVRARLTESGVQRVETWRRQRRERILRLLGPLDADEQAALQNLLARVLHEAERLDGDSRGGVAPEAIAGASETGSG